MIDLEVLLAAYTQVTGDLHVAFEVTGVPGRIRLVDRFEHVRIVGPPEIFKASANGIVSGVATTGAASAGLAVDADAATRGAEALHAVACTIVAPSNRSYVGAAGSPNDSLAAARVIPENAGAVDEIGDAMKSSAVGFHFHRD